MLWQTIGKAKLSSCKQSTFSSCINICLLLVLKQEVILKCKKKSESVMIVSEKNRLLHFQRIQKEIEDFAVLLVKQTLIGKGFDFNFSKPLTLSVPAVEQIILGFSRWNTSRVVRGRNEETGNSRICLLVRRIIFLSTPLVKVFLETSMSVCVSIVIALRAFTVSVLTKLELLVKTLLNNFVKMLSTYGIRIRLVAKEFLVGRYQKITDEKYLSLLEEFLNQLRPEPIW